MRNLGYYNAREDCPIVIPMFLNFPRATRIRARRFFGSSPRVTRVMSWDSVRTLHIAGALTNFKISYWAPTS